MPAVISFLVVLLAMAAATAGAYFKGRLYLFRLLISYELWKTIVFAVVVILFPAVVLAGWEWLNLSELMLPHHSGETGWHVLSVYFNSIYPAIPPLSGENLKVTHILFFAAGLMGYLLISGVLLSLFVNVLQNKVKNIEQGDEPCIALRNHLVVFGRGSMPVAFLKNTLPEAPGRPARCKDCCFRWFVPENKIVVVTEDSVPQMRELMKRDLPKPLLDRIVYVHGSRNSERLLKTLSLPHCSEMVMLGDPEHPETDDMNIAAVSLVSKVMQEAQLPPVSKKRCRVYFERYSAYTLFSELIKGELGSSMYFDPQCSYKTWADIVLGATSESGLYRPLDYRPLTVDSADAVHLVIIGMSRMGLALAAEAAQLLHFPNHKKVSPHITRITMIDAAARREMERWKLRNKEFFRECAHTYTEADASGKLVLQWQQKGWLDVEINFIQAAAESSEVMALLEQYGKEEHTLLTVAVCLPDPRAALTVGLNLPSAVYGEKGPGVDCGANILIQQDQSNGILDMLTGKETTLPRYRHVRAFGMADSPLGLHMEPDDAASMASALYNVKDKAKTVKEEVDREVEEKALKAWQAQRTQWDAKQHWERFSNRCQVASRFSKLRSIGLTQEEVLTLNMKSKDVPEELLKKVKKMLGQHTEALAETEHRRWIVEKLMLGYEPVPREVWECACDKKKLKDNFRHGDICSYDQLSFGSREYNRFVSRFLYCLLPCWAELYDPKEK